MGAFATADSMNPPTLTPTLSPGERGQTLGPNRFNAPIGVFDSGGGGLSVLRALRAQLPDESFVYAADQAHVPYGPRPLEQVRRFSEGLSRFLLNKGARIIVVACNSASAAAIKSLKRSADARRTRSLASMTLLSSRSDCSRM